MSQEQKATSVPPAMKIQLARLFGSKSSVAKVNERTPRDWKLTLNQVLDELEHYLEKNVHTDTIHYLMLRSGLHSARESLKEEDFLLGYIEGITRLALLLIGDYPDHRKRKLGRKQANYYELSHFRSQIWLQNSNQRLNTLIAAWNLGILKLTKNPMDALGEFRDQYGFKPDYEAFFEWYKQIYPQDYASVF